MNRIDFAEKKCKPCEGGTPPLTEAEIKDSLKRLPHWESRGGRLVRTFSFKNYYETTAFVNAVAWIAHQEDHHPQVSFGYKQCEVSFMTHAVKGISDNDFICAAKVNRLIPD